MTKKLIGSSILAIMLLSGCNSDLKEGNCSFNAQQSIDKEEYNSAINLLNSEECKTSMPTLSLNNNLGVSYLGLAGFSIYDIIGSLIKDTNGASTSASFISDITSNKKNNTLQDLEKAIGYFSNVKDNLNCSALDLNNAEKDACLYIGLAETVKASVTFSYLTKDLDKFLNSDGNSDDMIASSCAMEYALTTPSSCSSLGTDVSSIVELPEITFANTKTYTPTNVNVNGIEYQYLISKVTTPNNSILTENLCDLSFNTCNSIYDNNCYACPVDQTNSTEELYSIDLIVDSINNGTDSISSVINDPEIEQSIIDFKNDISPNGDITNQDILDYLNKN
jgi:hypothetical protein